MSSKGTKRSASKSGSKHKKSGSVVLKAEDVRDAPKAKRSRSNRDHRHSEDAGFELDQALASSADNAPQRKSSWLEDKPPARLPPIIKPQSGADDSKGSFTPDEILPKFNHPSAKIAQAVLALSKVDMSRFIPMLQRQTYVHNLPGEGRQMGLEFLRFLLPKIVFEDWNAEKISPTPIMDAVWHNVILDTEAYEQLQSHLGVKIHHCPYDAMDTSPGAAERRAFRLMLMTQTYVTFFSTHPLVVRFPLVRGHMATLTIKHWGKETTVLADLNDTIVPVAMQIAEQEGLPVRNFRILFNGQRVTAGTPLVDYDILDGDQIDIQLEYVGC